MEPVHSLNYCSTGSNSSGTMTVERFYEQSNVLVQQAVLFSTYHRSTTIVSVEPVEQ